MANSPYHTATWRKLRPSILKRDDYTCQISLPNCTYYATHVDHIVSWQRGGAWYDESNLRAACAECNKAKANPRSWANSIPSRQWLTNR